jgi:CCR4-NOT transcriptional regulation complex NOT5 subunit
MYQEVNWINKNAPNPLFNLSLLNSSKGCLHKREGVHYVFKEYVAQTLLDFSKDTNNKVADTPNGNVVAIPNVNAANTPTNNAVDTPANNTVDTPTNNTADTPANNVKDTPAEPTNSLLAALTHRPNRANFFASKHDAKVLKDMYNNI